MKTRALALAAFLPGVACTSDPTSTSPSLTERSTQTPLPSGLSLGITVSPRRLVLGDTARIRVALTNRADTTIELQFPSGCQLHFMVAREWDAPVVDDGNGQFCAQFGTELRLAPGATVNQAFQWTPTRITAEPLARAFKQPGTYRAYPTLLAHAGSRAEQRGTPASFEVVDTATYGAKPDVAVSVTTARWNVRSGDTVSVLVTFRNTGAETAQMRFTSSCQFRIAFYENDGPVSGRPESVVGDACRAAPTTTTLAPGDRRVERVVWRAVGADDAPLPPSGYVVVATLGNRAPETRLEAPHAFLVIER